MGLGKTISAIALISTLCTSHWESFGQNQIGEDNFSTIGPFLIVCPATMINQWVEELKLWTTSLSREIPILTFMDEENVNKRTVKGKKSIIDQAFKNDGIIITSYEFLRADIEMF